MCKLCLSCSGNSWIDCWLRVRLVSTHHALFIEFFQIVFRKLPVCISTHIDFEATRQKLVQVWRSVGVWVGVGCVVAWIFTHYRKSLPPTGFTCFGKIISQHPLRSSFMNVMSYRFPHTDPLHSLCVCVIFRLATTKNKASLLKLQHASRWIRQCFRFPKITETQVDANTSTTSSV